MAPLRLRSPKRQWARPAAHVAAGTSLFTLAVSTKISQSASQSIAAQAAVYYGFILTAISVIVAIAFAESSRWPSLTTVARHAFFAEFIILGALAAATIIVGLLIDNSTVQALAAWLWFAAAITGVLSLVRTFQLSTHAGLERLLTRQLASSFHHASRQAPSSDVQEEHREAIEDAITDSGTRLLRLANQVRAARGLVGPTAVGFSYSLATCRTVMKAALLGTLDGRLAAQTIRCLLEPAAFEHGPEHNEARTVHITQSARWLAWMMHSTWIMHDQRLTATATARQLIETGNQLRIELLRVLDPEPKSALPDEFASPITTSDLACYSFLHFQAHQGPGAAASGYMLYQVLTGDRYHGDYFVGSPLLADLRIRLNEAPFTLGSPSSNWRVQDFDDFVVDALALQLATARDRRITHPPQLTMGDFTDADQVPEAMAGLAFHFGGLDTETDALEGFMRAVVAKHPLRNRFAELDSLGSPLPASELSASSMAPAIALVQSLRLEGAYSGASCRFMELLSPNLQQAVAELAARLLPEVAQKGVGSTDMVGLYAEHLRRSVEKRRSA